VQSRGSGPAGLADAPGRGGSVSGVVFEGGGKPRRGGPEQRWFLGSGASDREDLEARPQVGDEGEKGAPNPYRC
jgi:hypothetical protein